MGSPRQQAPARAISMRLARCFQCFESAPLPLPGCFLLPSRPVVKTPVLPPKTATFISKLESRVHTSRTNTPCFHAHTGGEMSRAPRQSRGLHPIRRAASVFRVSVEPHERFDPDGLRYVATIPVWAHWLVVAFSFAQMAYRPSGWPERYAVYPPLFLLQRLGAGQCEVPASVPPSDRCHLIGLRPHLAPGGLVWVLE